MTVRGPALQNAHLTGLESLPTQEIEKILTVAGQHAHWLEEDAPKTDVLRGRVVTLGFLEPSTRTRVSFEIAGKRLGADTINLSGSGSSLQKGETLLDTVQTLESMGVACLVLRHSGSRVPQEMAARVQSMAVVNGGDGSREHPTQALLDVLAMRRYGVNLAGMKVALVGDIAYSRVARSSIYALTALGAEVTVCGPPSLLPQGLEEMAREPGKVRVTWSLGDALEDAGAVIALRLQRERQDSGLIPSIPEYVHRYQINTESLRVANPECVVLHPGPLNREIEIDSRVADGPRSLVRQQVTAGVAVRCAVLERACQVGDWKGESQVTSTEDASSMETAQS